MFFELYAISVLIAMGITMASASDKSAPERARLNILYALLGPVLIGILLYSAERNVERIREEMMPDTETDE